MEKQTDMLQKIFEQMEKMLENHAVIMQKINKDFPEEKDVIFF
jgi:hypothetical protein